MKPVNGRGVSGVSRSRSSWLRGAGIAALVGISISYVGTPSAESDADTALAAFDDGAPEPVTETPDPAPEDQVPGPPGHEPGTMYPADEGAWEWDDLSPKEQADAEAAQEWAETANGNDVHNAFSAAVATTSLHRQINQAQQAVGLGGVETIGVVIP